MNSGEIVSGHKAAWALIRKLGEGDAGEVYLVESLIDHQVAIIKRPGGKAFSDETLRQSTQIQNEGLILRALGRIPAGSGGPSVRVPEVFDHNKPENGYRDRIFIVVERAQGYDLNTLARVARGELNESLGLEQELDALDEAFLGRIRERGRIPAATLLNVLDLSLNYLEKIHQCPLEIAGENYQGIIWNDVKPDHLFWDPRTSRLTLIDWGNAQPLGEDGRTPDRQRSAREDYRQWIEEMGKFLSAAAPELLERLAWSAADGYADLSEESLAALRERLDAAREIERQALNSARASEIALLQGTTADASALEALDRVQAQILDLGELPDFAGALRYAAGCATLAIHHENTGELAGLSAWAARLPAQGDIDWSLIERMAGLAGRFEGAPRRAFLDATLAAVCADWSGALWLLLGAAPGGREPDWWYELSTAIRRQQIGVEADAVPPFLAVKRALLALQARIQQEQDRTRADGSSPEGLAGMQALAQVLKAEVVPNWGAKDPRPPHSGLAYGDILALAGEIGRFLPETGPAIARAVAQPQAQAEIALAAWAERNFLTAGNALRWILLWDPDRRRVLHAEKAIRQAPAWLKKVHVGPEKEVPLNEYVTDLEYEGRELRNQVGPAGWLDEILDGLAGLRKGTWPSDLVAAQPALLREMPWLKNYERKEVAEALAAVSLGETLAHEPELPAGLRGVREAELGPGKELSLDAVLDAWVPEARGSSARVFSGRLSTGAGAPLLAAIKLMRMDKVDYALPLFREEVDVLAVMDGVPGVNRLLECGFIHYAEDGLEPPDQRSEGIQAVRGDVVRIGPDAAGEFGRQIEERIAGEWVPYVAIEPRRQEDNLLTLCDAGGNHGRYRPVTELLQMAIQICAILDAAHQRNVVYRDHKILHYYWQAEENGVYIIDWNVSRLHRDGLSDVDVHMDLVQFGARGLHHILTGRAAPGALPLGPTRPEEIENAAQSYTPQWTYDDQRLSPEIREIIEAVLAGSYTRAADLGEDLKRAYMQLPNLR